MKSVLIMADIEGGIGIWKKEQCKPGTPAWKAACHAITADVSAAARGALRAGARSVWVRDMHGPGYNIRPGSLPSGVRCIRGQYLKPIRLIGRLPAVEGAVFVGWHAAPDQQGSFSPHIFHKKIRWVHINGRPVTEVELFAAVLGEHGIPVLFVSAQQCVLERVRKTLPWITAFPVPKEPLSDDRAAELRRRLTHEVAQALKSHGRFGRLLFGRHRLEALVDGRRIAWTADRATETYERLADLAFFDGLAWPLRPLLLAAYVQGSRLGLRLM
ncbi:D-aminopeptidase [Desulfacinum hydrothermale DSM 13146]|uniref:D-aminopeptidase n=1 Tax=Desulfacinum hydrothermale DSM 13146 TaxID=1121390 RepID=A0A1W1XDD0_9BACT|nr:M55 family metallopeptidase [Desulfacinum hydrothermale]SMC21890.1 D-aminopeptidase [Desulfacinum hydrothermale DSM 13146]